MCEVSSQGTCFFSSYLRSVWGKYSVGFLVFILAGKMLVLMDHLSLDHLWTICHCSQNPVLTMPFSKHKMYNGCINKNKHEVLGSKEKCYLFIVCVICGYRFHRGLAGQLKLAACQGHEPAYWQFDPCPHFFLTVFCSICDDRSHRMTQGIYRTGNNTKNQYILYGSSN